MKNCWVLFPWLGDACDKKHGREAPSAHDGEAEHTGVNPSDLQHVSDKVLEETIASLHAARVALSDGQEERTSDLRSRVLGGQGTLAATGSAHDATQGHASTVEARTSANSTASAPQCVSTPRDLGDRAAGILVRA